MHQSILITYNIKEMGGHISGFISKFSERTDSHEILIGDT